MKLLILGLNYTPEPIGIAPYTAGLAQFLATRGHDVSVVAGNPYYPDWALSPGFENRFTTAQEAGVTVHRVPHYIPAIPSGSRRMLHHVSFAIRAAKAMSALERHDLVLAIAPSLIAAPVAMRAARKWGAVSWLHIQDFEVEAALATGLMSGAGLASLARRFEQKTIARFDHVSSISRPMVRKAKDKGARTVHEMRNWAQLGEAPSEGEIARLRAELGIPGGRVALYSGNLALKQGSEIICEAARLSSQRKDLQWVVCGQGSARAAFEQAACDLPNLHLRPLVPREKLAALLAMADVHVLTQIAGAADLVLPSKLANMLASARPVAATADPGTGLAGEVEGCGLLVEPGDAAGLARAVERLLDRPELCRELGRNAGMRARERWSQPVLLKRFALALEAAVERHNRQ